MSRLGSVKQFGDLFTVHIVPVLRDNFSYVIHDKIGNTAAVVDATTDLEPVFRVVEGLQLGSAAAADKAPFAVMSTHKHWDHSGGNKPLFERFGASLQVFGGAMDNIPHCTHPLQDRDEFSIGALKVRALFTPCHTSGHVLYHVHAPSSPDSGAALFTGDTLFVGGVGAFFEGDADKMLAIVHKLRHEVPDPAQAFIFPGHEYTVNFMKFSASVDKSNVFIQSQLAAYEAMRAKGLPTVPSTLADEFKQNLFLRCDDPALRAAMGKQGADVTSKDMMEAVYNACP